MNLEWKMWIDRVRSVVRELIPGAKVRVDKSTLEMDEITFLVECRELPDTDILMEVLKKEFLRKSSLPFYSPFKIVLRNSDGRTREVYIP